MAGNVADADVNALLDAALTPQAQDLGSIGQGLFGHGGDVAVAADAFGPMGMSGMHHAIMDMLAVQSDAAPQA